jgi:hypothetical protein
MNLRVYPQLKPEVQKILEQELGEVIDEFPYDTFSNDLGCKVKLREPLKVFDSENYKGLACNYSSRHINTAPLWLSVFIASTSLEKPSWSFPSDGDTEIYLKIKLEQDKEYFWRKDYPDFETDATSANMLKEVRILAKGIREKGLRKI